MIKKYLKRLIIINKEAILMEVLSIKGLIQVLMKTRNTDENWTREEKKEMRFLSSAYSCGSPRSEENQKAKRQWDQVLQ